MYLYSRKQLLYPENQLLYKPVLYDLCTPSYGMGKVPHLTVLCQFGGKDGLQVRLAVQLLGLAVAEAALFARMQQHDVGRHLLLIHHLDNAAHHDGGNVNT